MSDLDRYNEEVDSIVEEISGIISSSLDHVAGKVKGEVWYAYIAGLERALETVTDSATNCDAQEELVNEIQRSLTKLIESA